MKRDELEEAIRLSNNDIAKQSVIQIAIGVGWFLCLTAFLLFYPFENIENRFNIGFPIWVICLIIWLRYGSYQDSAICKSHNLICVSCKKTHRHNDFLEIILENKCKSCGRKVYET